MVYGEFALVCGLGLIKFNGIRNLIIFHDRFKQSYSDSYQILIVEAVVSVNTEKLTFTVYNNKKGSWEAEENDMRK